MIEVMSFNHGVSMPLTAGPSNTSRASGRCVHQDFTLTKTFELASRRSTSSVAAKTSSHEAAPVRKT